MDTQAMRPSELSEKERLARTTTHLANSRTFLAWVRTVIALMAFGFVLERIDLFLVFYNLPVDKRLTQNLGLLSQSCFAAGAAILLLAAWRSYNVARNIGSDGTPHRDLPEVVLLLAVLVLGLVLAVFGGRLLL